jgi:small subunit ribosomal protein S20
VRSQVKTEIVKARRSFTQSPVAEADRAAQTTEAIRALDRAAAKGILHRNNAARRKGRLMRQLVKVGGSTVVVAAKTGKSGKAGKASAAGSKATGSAKAASGPAAPAKKPAKK